MKRKIPLLPLRELIVFPHEVVPLFVGREKSINALEEAMADDRHILLCAQKKAKVNDPKPDGIHTYGTIGTIIQLLRLPDGTVKVLVEGKTRARIDEYLDTGKFFFVECEQIEAPKIDPDDDPELAALMRSVQATFENYVKLNKRVPPELAVSVQSIDNPSRLADTIAAHVNFKLIAKQELLETESVRARLEKLYELMQNEIEILQVEKKIRTRVKKQMEKNQKEYYLNEQMQAIQKELGSQDEFKNELQELEERIRRKKMTKEAQERLKKELKKLKMMSPMSAEATVVRNYIDTVLGLPWLDRTDDKVDVEEAEKILDEDHYGLEKPKQRIIEYLAVQALVKKIRGPILCLVGPPGVGKTSLAKSVARATDRKFVRVSLGGVRDEAEIRGHRRTYIGAMPGKIIQGIRRAGSSNPVFLLDEIDKMSMDFRGDPSAAMLEVLDPEQNIAFVDHFLDLDYDLSEVLFICTANSLHTIPIPLRDRMEIIELSGYTDEDKLKIAKQYLVPKQTELNGLEGVDVQFSDSAIKELIHHYTKEAGVRSLEREVAAVLRKLAREYVKEAKKKKIFRVDGKHVNKLLGPQKYRFTRAEENDMIGMANGLAYTPMGGDLLPVETTITSGKGKVTLTGHRRGHVRPLAQPRARPRSRFLRVCGFPPALPRGRGAQGRPLGGRHDRHEPRVGAALRPGPQGRRDDGRDQPARQGAADRRPQGEGARRLPGRHQDGDLPEGEREGSARDPQERDAGARVPLRREHRRGAAHRHRATARGSSQPGAREVPRRGRPGPRGRLASGQAVAREAQGTRGPRPGDRAARPALETRPKGPSFSVPVPVPVPVPAGPVASVTSIDDVTLACVRSW
jgi:ATP-dependent Lon protease